MRRLCCRKDSKTRSDVTRLTAKASDHGFVYTLAKSGTLVVTTRDRNGVAGEMQRLGISQPAQLIDAAERWGLVEIREEENPDWRGG